MEVVFLMWLNSFTTLPFINMDACQKAREQIVTEHKPVYPLNAYTPPKLICVPGGVHVPQAVKP